MESKEVLNINVGILGHVDSGKTSLAKALSTVSSTAAFDKNPQSRERGITLDLGFSSFTFDVDDSLRERIPDIQSFRSIQVTLVDCPGHASLFRTVIGGSQIIDLVFLVLDVTKGFQTQTAECLLLAQITRPAKMILVGNKVDCLEAAKRDSALQKLEKRIRKTLETTPFADAPFVPLSASPGAEDNKPEGVDKLLEILKSVLFIPERSDSGPFLYAVDHCFLVRGQGTVLTGTVLSGKASIGDSVEIPHLGLSKKIKSIQVFRRPVQSVRQGDRCGICTTQLEAKQMERGLVCEPGTLPQIFAAVVSVDLVAYFKGSVKSKGKFHVSIGYDTVMGRWSFFGRNDASKAQFRPEDSYKAIETVRGEEVPGGEKWDGTSALFALVEFETPVICPDRSLYIASRMDADVQSNSCRLAFHGRLLVPFHEKNPGLGTVRVYKEKRKEGVVDRMLDESTLVVRSLVKKETNREAFVGLKVRLSTGEDGVIEGGFGQSGKVKVRLTSQLKPETEAVLAKLKKKKGDAETLPGQQSIKVILEFKRFMFDPLKKMLQ